jgi:tRNA 2-thiouridine synthesizing protein A
MDDRHLLDARGLACPLPVLKARKRLMGMAPGERLRVLATDPKAPGDFRLYCQESGHRLVEEGQDGDDFVLVVERSP